MAPQEWADTGEDSLLKISQSQASGGPIDQQRGSLDMVQKRSYAAKAAPESDGECKRHFYLSLKIPITEVQ